MGMESLCLVCGKVCAQYHVIHKNLVTCIFESTQVLHEVL